MFDIISTREFAHITLYGSVILFCFIKSEKLRHSLVSFIKLLFNPKAFLIFDFFTLYEAVMLLPITYLPFWKNTFYKDFIFWVILGGYPALLKYLKTSNADFRKMIFKQFIFSLAVEYLTGMITFNLVVEYFLCIFFSILIIADDYAEKQRHPLNCIKSIIFVSGIVLLAMTIRKSVIDFKNYNNMDTIIKMLIPICAYISSIPFLYMFIIIAKYEELFCLINGLERSNSHVTRKKDAFLWCGLNIDRISIFRKLYPLNREFTKKEFEDLYYKRVSIEELEDKWFHDDISDN